MQYFKGSLRAVSSQRTTTLVLPLPRTPSRRGLPLGRNKANQDSGDMLVGSKVVLSLGSQRWINAHLQQPLIHREGIGFKALILNKSRCR